MMNSNKREKILNIVLIVLFPMNVLMAINLEDYLILGTYLVIVIFGFIAGYLVRPINHN